MSKLGSSCASSARAAMVLVLLVGASLVFLVVVGTASAASATMSPEVAAFYGPSVAPVTENPALVAALAPGVLDKTNSARPTIAASFQQGVVPSDVSGPDSTTSGPYQDPVLVGAAAMALRPQTAGMAAGTATATTTAQPAGVFGISDENLQGYVCNPSAPPVQPLNCGGTKEAQSYTYFASNLSLGYARIFVPYDTVMTYNTFSRQCQAAYTPRGSTTWLQLLTDWLNAAKAAGLQPLIALTAGAGGYFYNGGTYYADPTVPNLTSGTNDENSYICGLEGLMNQTSGMGLPVTQYEAWNEPDRSYPAGMDMATRALNAYDMYVIAALTDRGLGRSDTLPAGTFASASSTDVASGGFAYDYVNDLASANVFPAVWSMHPYHDVQHGGSCSYVGNPSCSLTETTNALNLIDLTYYSYNKYYSSSYPQMWLSEAAVWLNGAYGSLVDGNPTAEANAAVNFLALYGQTCCQVTRDYYYEMQTVPGDSFDSALIGTDGSSPQTGDRSNQAVFRPSYCVLAFAMAPSSAVSTANCNDYTHSPTDSDWEDPSG